MALYNQTEARNHVNTVGATNPVFDLIMTPNDLSWSQIEKALTNNHGMYKKRKLETNGIQWQQPIQCLTL